MPSIGTCFQLLHNLETDDNHFWIVISKSVDGRVLVVNMTDSAKCPDLSCQLKVGEHSTITKPSAIFYKKTRVFEASKIDAELASAKYVRQMPNFPQNLM